MNEESEAPATGQEPITAPAAGGKPVINSALLQSPEARAIIAEAIRQARESMTPIVLDSPVKVGWQTTEFWTHWLFVAGLALASFAGSLPPQWAAVAGALSQAAYNISRGLTKSSASN